MDLSRERIPVRELLKTAALITVIAVAWNTFAPSSYVFRREHGVVLPRSAEDVENTIQGFGGFGGGRAAYSVFRLPIESYPAFRSTLLHPTEFEFPQASATLRNRHHCDPYSVSTFYREYRDSRRPWGSGALIYDETGFRSRWGHGGELIAVADSGWVTVFLGTISYGD